MRGLSLEEANTIIAASFAEAKKRKCRPMSAIVLDAGDRVKAFQKQDGTRIAAPWGGCASRRRQRVGPPVGRSKCQIRAVIFDEGPTMWVRI